MAKANRKLSRFAKRHYEAIAEAMQEARTHLRCDAIKEHECVIGMLADMFAADNSQFKRERFINACQPGANVRARTQRMQHEPLLTQQH
jgi:hypothetical protein